MAPPKAPFPVLSLSFSLFPGNATPHGAITPAQSREAQLISHFGRPVLEAANQIRIQMMRPDEAGAPY
jgi:hypothetical protein